MQQMADAKGVGPQLTDARNRYRDYMQSFKESSGPNHSAIAMNAPDAGHPTNAVKPLS